MANNPRAFIIGEHNVGKSTLFAWLTGKAALVSDKPGTTIDYREAPASFMNEQVDLVDTRGYRDTRDPAWSKLLNFLTGEQGIVLWMLSSTQSLHADHYLVMEQLRKTGKQIILVYGKWDYQPQERLYYEEVYRLPVEKIVAVSARQRRGQTQLAGALRTCLNQLGDGDVTPVTTSTPKCTIGIIGKPNAGKSTLLNTLLGYERVVVDARPGTTTDPVTATTAGHIKIIDTAGIAKSTGAKERRFFRIPQIITRSDVVCLVFDAQLGLTVQDTRLANLAHESGKPVIFVANKIDLTSDRQALKADLTATLRNSFSQVCKNSLLCISAKQKFATDRLCPLAEKLHAFNSTRLETRPLNTWLKELQLQTSTPLLGAKQLKLKYISQKSTNPPRFVLFANLMPPTHYVRYLRRRLASQFNLTAIPLQLEIRKNLNPFIKRDLE